MILENGKITASEIKRLKSRMGVDLRIEQFNSSVTQDNILKFVRTVGDDNPLWCDCTYAKNTVYGNIIAPPSFYNYLSEQTLFIPQGFFHNIERPPRLS